MDLIIKVRILAPQLLLWAMATGCTPYDDDGGGGGGPALVFSKGYVFVQSDSRNVFVADEANLSRTARLTSSGLAKEPSLARDGKQVVFVASQGSDTEIQVVATVSGSSPSPVLKSDANRKNFRSPVFTADGAAIVFTFDKGTASLLGKVNVDGSGFVELTSGSPSMAGASLFPDGNTLLAMGGSNPAALRELYRVPVAPGAAQLVSANLGNEVVVLANRVVVSPNGNRAAFDARVASAAVRIFTVDLSGSGGVVQLTDYKGETANDGHPFWVGSEEVGFSSDSGGADHLYGLPAASVKTSGGLKPVSGTQGWYGPN